jgi:hypothetical protein
LTKTKCWNISFLDQKIPRSEMTGSSSWRGLLKLTGRLIRQIPMAGTAYTALRQIFQTAVREDRVKTAKKAAAKGENAAE